MAANPNNAYAQYPNQPPQPPQQQQPYGAQFPQYPPPVGKPDSQFSEVPPTYSPPQYGQPGQPVVFQTTTVTGGYNPFNNNPYNTNGVTAVTVITNLQPRPIYPALFIRGAIFGVVGVILIAVAIYIRSSFCGSQFFDSACSVGYIHIIIFPCIALLNMCLAVSSCIAAVNDRKKWKNRENANT
ncbi:hypothetical protein HK098_007535 [Nowakowskiella sp. JEL0407]|nr:hypothetical protein HK098_007535 [Nowakowskiella sp. JEL0407]